MTDRQFYWGLSKGTTALSMAGFFWLGLAMSDSPRTQPFFLVLVAALVVLIVGTMGVRRKAKGFRFSDLRQGDEQLRRETRRITAGLRWTVVGQAVLIAVGVYACVRAGRQDLMWPWMGVVASLHFLPLGRVFHVPTYYATGLAGAAVSSAALLGLPQPWSLAALGSSMGALMWLTAVYVVRNADRIVSDGIESIHRTSPVAH